MARTNGPQIPSLILGYRMNELGTVGLSSGTNELTRDSAPANFDGSKGLKPIEGQTLN